MVFVKKIDDVGRISIPRELRRTLMWDGGDEIEIIVNEDGSLLLRKRNLDTAKRLKELRLDWKDDADVAQKFNELIALIKSKN